jgi:HlyD family secretion protein
MKKKIWIILGLILLAGVGTGAWFLWGGDAEKVEWKTAKIEKGDLQMTVRASGTLQAVTTVQVGTQVSGIIKNIFVDFNSEVREGQIIAVLDTTLLAQAVEDARAALRRSEIQVNQTKREFERTKLLFEQKVMAQADYDLSLTNFETAETNLISSRSALSRAKINLRYATIIAPISGVVVSRAVDVGQTVAASFSTPTMFTIANDLTKMQVQANIDEGDIGKIRVDQEVTFTVDAYTDATFSGTVKQVRLQPVVTQNVVNYTVIIDVPNPDLKLLPGMTANITVLVDEVKDILKVPSTALRFSPPQEYIDVYEKSLPDSVKKMREMWSKRMQGGQGGQGSHGGQGGFGGPGGQGGPEGGMSRQGGGSQRRSGGTIWVKSGDSIRPHRVRTGVTDGLNTEVRGRNIKEGDEVVLGMVSNETKTTQTQQQNPFAPQMQRGSSGRGGR